MLEGFRSHIYEVQKLAQRVRKASKVDYRARDFRRTAASMMAGMGIPRLTISKILNHLEPGVTAVYDRHSYDKEKQEALNAWGELLHTVQTGEPGWQKRFGSPAFQYMVDHPERHSIYDSAMGGYGQAEGEAMLDAYNLSEFQTVVDVGGGSGMLMTAILKRYPDLGGILFDLPPVVDRARSIISDSGLSGRCRIEGGDFFSSIPAGADVYVMQHIIHDWDDAEAISILGTCREAMNPHSKVLLVETVIPKGNEPCFGKWLDLMMLLVGGRERTEEEYRRLLSAAGLTLTRVIPSALEVSIIEGIQAI